MSETERVLVTGAAGFIGRWVVAELLDRGHRVHGIDDFSGGTRENVAAFESNDSFAMREVDVTDRASLQAEFDGEYTACIHLAAEIDVHESLDAPMTHFRTNVVGTQHVLESCRQHDTPLTLVGTCMVYDVAEGEHGISETHPVKPASPYAGTKLAAEELALSYYRGFGLPVTVLRPFNTYGPYQRIGSAGGVVSIFTARDIRDQTLEIYGDGTQSRDLMYVTDCARFVVDGAFSDATVGEVVNGGTGTDISINELAELIVTSGSAVEHVPHHHPQSEIESLRCDPAKARDLLDWEPEVTLETGIGRLRDWLEGRETTTSA